MSGGLLTALAPAFVFPIPFPIPLTYDGWCCWCVEPLETSPEGTASGLPVALLLPLPIEDAGEPEDDTGDGWYCWEWEWWLSG